MISTLDNDPYREEFVRGMRDLGYVEGRNIAYEFRHYGDDAESIPALISDLLRAKVDIIVVGGTAALRAAQSAIGHHTVVPGSFRNSIGCVRIVIEIPWSRERPIPIAVPV